jgi:hypothetical protein
MRDFEAIIPTSKIIEWRRLSTPEQEIGGLLLLSIKDEGQELTSLEAFPVFWKNNGLRKQMVIGDYPVPESMGDMEILRKLRNRQTPLLTEIRFSELGFFEFESVLGERRSNQTLPEFELVFIEIGICSFLAEKDEYYYYPDSNIPPVYYIKPELGEANLVSNFTRGIVLRRGICELTGTGLGETNFYRTVISRPHPLPVITSRSSDSATIAYMLHPTCPPVWKPGYFFSMLRSSDYKYFDAVELETPIKVEGPFPNPVIDPSPIFKSIIFVIIGVLLTLFIQKIM